jgi:hypothetical protein
MLTQRRYNLKGVGTGDDHARLADGVDHFETLRQDLAPFRGQHHCWLYHELYDHDYGPGRPQLGFRDLLRIGQIWVDLKVAVQFVEPVP